MYVCTVTSVDMIMITFALKTDLRPCYLLTYFVFNTFISVDSRVHEEVENVAF